MSNFELKKLEALLQEKDLDKARTYISEVISGEAEEADRAAIYVALARVYIDEKNMINRNYLELLQEYKEALHAINVAEQQTNDAIDMASVKSRLL
jgi:hypothetical protein